MAEVSCEDAVVDSPDIATCPECCADEIKACRQAIIDRFHRAMNAFPGELQVELSSLKGDCDEGIFVFDDLEMNVAAYQNEIKKIRSRLSALGSMERSLEKWRAWEVVQEKLLADNAALLKRSVDLEGGGCLVGTLESTGELVIKQKSKSLVHFKWDEKHCLWMLSEDESVEMDGVWASQREMLDSVEMTGHFVPKNGDEDEKRGFIAAAEVLYGDYVSSEGVHYHSVYAIVDERDSEKDWLVVQAAFDSAETHIVGNNYHNRDKFQGAILWIIG